MSYFIYQYFRIFFQCFGYSQQFHPSLADSLFYISVSPFLLQIHIREADFDVSPKPSRNNIIILIPTSLWVSLQMVVNGENSFSDPFIHVFTLPYILGFLCRKFASSRGIRYFGGCSVVAGTCFFIPHW